MEGDVKLIRLTENTLTLPKEVWVNPLVIAMVKENATNTAITLTTGATVLVDEKPNVIEEAVRSASGRSLTATP